MFALLLLIVLAIVVFGVVSAVIGRSSFRWISLASGAFALLLLVSAAVLLLGSGVVAIGTNGSIAQLLIILCLLSMLIACFLCVISGCIAIRRRNAKNAA